MTTLNLVPIDSSRPLRGSARRDPAAATVEPSGRATFNAAAMEMIDALAIVDGLNIQTYALQLSVDPNVGVVGVQPVKPETAGSQAWRVSDDRRRGTFYIAQVLSAHQDLRITETRACPVSKYPDVQNPKWVIVTLKTSLRKLKGPARGDGANPTSPEAKPPQQEIDAP